MQINNCRGEMAKIVMRNGDVVKGRLSFFNYDEQVAHLHGYSLKRPDSDEVEEGKFMVINRSSWHTLSVKGYEDLENE